MAHKQCVEGFVVAFGVGSHQHIVGELVEFLHFYSSWIKVGVDVESIGSKVLNWNK